MSIFCPASRLALGAAAPRAVTHPARNAASHSLAPSRPFLLWARSSPPSPLVLQPRACRFYATRIVHPSDRKPVSPEGKPMFLSIDPSAVKQLHKIYSADGNPSQALRVLVEAGGCHGFQYKLDLVDSKQIADDDILFDNDGAKLVIDETSLELVNGSKLVFADELIGQEFRLVDNPNAGSSCGCGTSFEVKF